MTIYPLSPGIHLVYVFGQIGIDTNDHVCSYPVLNSGMQGPDGLFNDGLDLSTCKNNGEVCPGRYVDIIYAYAHHHRPRGSTIKSVYPPYELASPF